MGSANIFGKYVLRKINCVQVNRHSLTISSFGNHLIWLTFAVLIQTMASPQDLLENFAKALADNDFHAASGMFFIPSVVHIGTRKAVFHTRCCAVTAFATYRANLDVESFERTEIEFLHEAECKDGQVRLLLRWINFNDRGARISALEGCYFCARDETGAWKIKMAEFVAEGTPRMVQGLLLR